MPPPNKIDSFHFLIIGGGLSGILLALKLSLQKANIEKGICLLEEKSTLGGRLFFSQALSVYGKSRETLREEIYTQHLQSNNLSGFGFELYESNALEAINRHLMNQLSESEQAEIEAHLNQFPVYLNSKFEKLGRCFCVKKELILWQELISGSSELFTKKEADAFQKLSTGIVFSENNSESLDKNSPIAFEKTSFWQDLSKSNKENISDLLETILGKQWESAPAFKVQSALVSFTKLFSAHYPLAAYKRSLGLELILERILIKRGVEIRNSCRMYRLLKEKSDDFFQVLVTDLLNPEKKAIFAHQVILAIPLTKSLGIIPKEFYLAEQSRFAARVQPDSLVLFECSSFSLVKSQDLQTELKAYDRFLFPVEKAQAFYTSDDRLLLFTWLNYEDSLQTPAVREVVSRLRRALQRLLKTEFSEDFKKGAKIPKNKNYERIILLPVARSCPLFMPENLQLKNVKMGVQGLFCCGDSLAGYGYEPWISIIESISELLTIIE